MKKTIESSSHNVGFADIRRDTYSDHYADFLFKLRAEIIKNLELEGFSRADIARNLQVSRSVISRILDPTSDILASTLFDLAWALKKKWNVNLIPLEHNYIQEDVEGSESLQSRKIELYDSEEQYSDWMLKLRSSSDDLSLSSTSDRRELEFTRE